jgi:hypothetical protein
MTVENCVGRKGNSQILSKASVTKPSSFLSRVVTASIQEKSQI